MRHRTILSRLLGRPVKKGSPKQTRGQRPARKAKTSKALPSLSQLMRERVRLDSFPDTVGLILVAEMILQELERGYGDIELRGVGRTAADLADAAGVPVAIAERALMLLSLRWLARYRRTGDGSEVLLWAPVRELEASPYTFNISDVPGAYEPPERIDFKAALFEERERAAALGLKRRRGRPRKTPVTLR